MGEIQIDLIKHNRALTCSYKDLPDFKKVNLKCIYNKTTIFIINDKYKGGEN